MLSATLSDPPTALSAVLRDRAPTMMTVFWSPPITENPPTGYDITYFAGEEDTTGRVVPVTGGNVRSRTKWRLDPSITYRVSIVSVFGTSQSEFTGPVLAARGEHIHCITFPTGMCVAHHQVLSILYRPIVSSYNAF